MLNLFKDILSIDSTTGKERELSEFLYGILSSRSGPVSGGLLERMDVGDGTENLFVRWGHPEVVFCTHMDTVPPYIPPSFISSDGKPCDPDEASVVLGRGACDAKGQIISMLSACATLCQEGYSGFGLLLLSGEETGSYGAKAFARTAFRAPNLIVGEPTGNHLASVAKGTKSFDLHFTGEAFHSGYPEFGVSAVDLFVDFMERLRSLEIPEDPVSGKTTWNVGLLRSDNPQNILSPTLDCRIYFRTTPASDTFISEWMAGHFERLTVTPRGGDMPTRYFVSETFDSSPVSFGSDAPHLSNFTRKIICGPGSIRFAHRDDEQITVHEIREATALYVRLFKTLINLHSEQ